MMLDWESILAKSEPDRVLAASLTPAPHLEEEGPDEYPTDMLARERSGDNRRRCTECHNLNDRGLCLAAYRGEFIASRSYTPIRELLRRCEGFKPLPDDTDQRPGRDRWGMLFADPPGNDGGI